MLNIPEDAASTDVHGGRGRPSPPSYCSNTGFATTTARATTIFEPYYAWVGESWTNVDYSTPAAEWMKPLKRGKAVDLVEISGNWYLDDLPPMMFIKASPNSHSFVNPRDVEQLWRDQFDWVCREYEWAVFPMTIHPDVSGRPQVLLMLERLIEYINGHPGVHWCTMEGMAEEFRRRHPFKG